MSLLCNDSCLTLCNSFSRSKQDARLDSICIVATIPILSATQSDFISPPISLSKPDTDLTSLPSGEYRTFEIVGIVARRLAKDGDRFRFDYSPYLGRLAKNGDCFQFDYPNHLNVRSVDERKVRGDNSTGKKWIIRPRASLMTTIRTSKRRPPVVRPRSTIRNCCRTDRL